MIFSDFSTLSIYTFFMKKIVYTIVLFCVSVSCGVGQTFCLNFANQQVSGGVLTFDVMMSSSVAFKLGKSNLVFSYNSSTLFNEWYM